MLVFILECAARWQAYWHQLALARNENFLSEEWPVKLDEGDVMVASVQQFRLVSLVNHNFFNTPGINGFSVNLKVLKGLFTIFSFFVRTHILNSNGVWYS